MYTKSIYILTQLKWKERAFQQIGLMRYFTISVSTIKTSRIFRVPTIQAKSSNLISLQLVHVRRAISIFSHQISGRIRLVTASIAPYLTFTI